MSEKCENNNSEGVCQEWPKDSELKENMNKTLNTLKKVSENGDGVVYAYVLTTVKAGGHGGFVQTGSAPNFQGGFITLCTCMHWMRTWRTLDAWKDVWIAGFTGINILGDYRNYLFYLMRGVKVPTDCKLFKKICTPEDPKGACMVSDEGTCSTYLKYGGRDW